MADKKFDLVFNASLEVGQVKAAVASLSKSLESAGAKIPQSIATNLNRMIQSLSTELNKLEGMTDIQLDPKNAKNVGKSYEKIFQTFQQIKAALDDIHRTAGIDPEKFFPSEIASNIAKAAQAVQKYKKAIEAGVKTDEHTKATKDIAEAEKKVKSLNDKLDEAARKRQSSSIVKDQLQETRKKLQAEKDQAEAEDKAAKEAQKTIQDRIKSQERLAQVEEEIAKKKKKQQEAVNKAAKANEVKNERESMKQAKGKGTDTKIYRDAVASYAESTAEVQKLQSEIDQLEAEYTQLSQTATVTADEIAAANERATKAAAELTNAQKRLNKNQTDIDAADTKYTAATAEVKTLVPEVQKAENALNQLIQKKEQLEASFEQSTFDELIQELEKLGVKLPDTERNMEGVERALESMAAEARGKVATALEGVKDAAEGIGKPLEEAGKKADGVSELGEQARRAEQDMENLKNQVLDFFSITNTIQIFKNAVRDAFDTVKELDAAMTETAVVTDFSIGDMWDKLPEYSEQATKLGTSIKSLYEATTLYYQQGLDSNQAMGVGIETMKMARIANMDAAEATEAMTAALRGFNMEINEMSATRINDVYSELAAVTAADTSQIATAMSKTASIAESANMEFETTAALLAQIIETTQEAPETAGTAMKTIIARFTEVKQLFSEGMLTGEDSEGEEININKIDAALKTVGISLKDFLTGAKGIDDIFLELASKWDTLDLATQRYIATTAAGSRQQSRFLAMMSNYDRTMELVTAANNSAGASSQQFNKTLESLDAKLQRLQNAWAEFTMGLANSDVIKWAVDLLTSLLEGVNKLTGLAGNDGLGGVITMFVRLGTVIGALKGGKAILDGLLKTLTGGLGNPSFMTKFTENFISKDMGILQALLIKKKGAAGGFGKFTAEAKAASKTLDGVKTAFGAAGTDAKSFLGILGKFAPYIAIFAALAFAISKVVDSFQAAQKQSQIDNLNSSMQELASQSEQAQAKVEEIGESRSKLEDLNRTLNGLTKGTDEWKKALFEANNEVLNLIESYPVLSDYIGTGSSGQMIIEEAGWKALLDQQQRVITNLANAKIAIQVQKATLEKSLTFEQFATTSGAAYMGTDRERIDWNAVGYNFGLVAQASQEQQPVDLTELKEVLVPDTEQSKLEEKLIDAQIKMANWMDTPAGAAIAAANDASLYTDSAALAGAQIGKAIADWFGLPSMSLTPNQDLHKETMEDGGYSKQVYEDLLGLTEEQYLLLAQVLAENGITISADMDTDLFDSVYRALQLPEDALNQVRTAAIATAKEFNELGGAAAEYSRQERRLSNQFINNALTSGSFEGVDYISELANIISYQADYATMLQNEKNAAQKKASEGTSLRQQYADIFGGYIDASGKLYTDETRTQEILLEDDVLLEAIASANLEEVFRQVGQDMVAAFAEAEIDTDLVKQLFGTDGISITDETLGKYVGEDGFDLSSVIKDFGFEGETAFQDFVKIFGINAGQLLLDNFNMAADRITKARVDLAKKMRRSNDGKTKDFATEDEYIASELKRLEDTFGSGIRDTLNSIFNSLGETGDQALIDAGYQKFMEVSETGSGKDLERIAAFVEEVDWSNPIQAVKRLNYEVQNGSKLTADYAQTLLQIGSSALDGGAQMRYLLQSADFSDLKEDIQEVIDEQGELSAMDVLDLADSYDELNDVMENTEATAAGLAELLERIANGEIEVDKVTDVVMAALKGFESLDSYVAKVLKKIEDFDWGSSENSVNDFMSETWEDIIVPNIEAGRFNNSQLNKWMDLVAGSGWDAEMTGNQRRDTMVQYALEWKKYTEAGSFEPFFERAAANQTFLGEAKTVDTSAGSKYAGLDVVANADGSYSITGYEGHDIKTIESFLAEQLNISEDMAAMALVDMRQQNADRKMDEYFTQQDITKSLTSALAEAETTRIMTGRKQAFDSGEESAVYYANKKIVDQSEIDAIVALYGEEYADAIQSYFESNAVITNFYDEEGALKSAEEIGAELNRVFSSKEGAEAGAKWIEGFATHTSNGKAIVNWDQVMQGLADANVPEHIRADVAEGLIQGFDTEVPTSVTVTLSDGSEKTIEITPDIDMDTAIANAEREMELGYLESSITSAIQAAFGTDGLKINFTEASAAELTAAVEAAVPDSVDTTVNYVPGSQAGIISIPSVRNVTVNYLLGDDEGLNGDIGGEIKPKAKGIKNSPTAFTALVSEEGPELIQTKDGAYLTGQNGPELAQIHKGDTVYTAKETAAILTQRKHKTIPRFSKGITGYGGGVNLTGDGSGGSSNDDDEDTWENSFDKLYNLVREIDEELRRRERLERRYEKLLESVDLTAGKLFDNAVEQLRQLEKEKLLNKELQEARRYQIQQYQQENADLMKYAKVVQNERGEDVLRIHWDQINLVEDPEQGQRIEDYVSQLEEWFDSLEEAEDKLNDIEDRIEEVKELGKEEYLDFENAVKDAITFAYQEEIDKLSEINESINDTNTQLIDAISKQVSRMRQQRENERTEQELQEKQRQLLYLSQDTSGANDMAILELQKEIEEGTVDYTDTLIDQKIDELQMQNDEAAQQREQQITLMQAQLDHLIQSGEIWDEVYSLMDEGLDQETGLVRGSRLEQMLKSAEGFQGMSKVQQMDWLKELQQQAAQAVTYMRLTTEKIDTAVELNRQNYFGGTTPEPEYNGDSSSGSGGTSSGGGSSDGGSSGGYTQNPGYTKEQIKSLQQNANISVDGIWGPQTAAAYDKGFRPSGPSNSWESENSAYWDSQKGNNSSNNSSNSNNSNKTPKQVVIYYSTAKKTVTYDYNSDWQNLRKTWEKQWGPSSIIEYKYKQGGLADFTGPAWLDGTKSRPELVLNQKDTQNFIQLKDILASLMTGSHISTENNGDITYDIDINVESIGSDYDVEQVANKVKSLINEDARYRNNNAVSLKR